MYFNQLGLRRLLTLGLFRSPKRPESRAPVERPITPLQGIADVQNGRWRGRKRRVTHGGRGVPHEVQIRENFLFRTTLLSFIFH